MLNVFKLLSDDKMGTCGVLPFNNFKYATRGHDKKLKKNGYNCILGKYSFSLRVTNLWSSLTPKTTHANSVNMFKRLLDEELFHLHMKLINVA